MMLMELLLSFNHGPAKTERRVIYFNNTVRNLKLKEIEVYLIEPYVLVKLIYLRQINYKMVNYRI